MSKCRMCTKNHYREIEIWFKQKKLDLEWTISGLEKQLRKKIRSKRSNKNSKNHSENAAFEQKPTARKRIFVQSPFSHSKKIHAAKPLAFSLLFPFRLDQNH